MHLRLPLLISVAVAALLALPAAASAYFVHVIAPGESLSSIAAADGLSVQQLAAANGLSPDAQLILGSDIQIPPQQAGVSAPAAATATAPAVAGDGDSDADDTGSTATAVPATATTTSASYVVQPGDTLTAIAARAGMTVDELAALNGLDPNNLLISGTAIRVSGSSGSSGPVYVSTDTSSASAASQQPVGAPAEGNPIDPPYPTPERVNAPEVGSIAAANGVPASLADAIAWQESGFNNDLVSSADARGVMQILPGTWQWIQSDLNTGAPLAPASAADNVRGGVEMLHSLLDATGGDSAEAAAAYYQGLSSVQQHGMYSDTQQYVHDVLSLEQQFGGGG